MVPGSRKARRSPIRRAFFAWYRRLSQATIDAPGSADSVPSQPEGSGVGQAYEQRFELGVLVSCHPGSGCASVWERGVVEKNTGAQAAITC